MKISCAWVKDFLPKAKLEPAAVAERLSLTLAEVEAIHHRGQWLDNKVVVAKIIAVSAHPHADHLQIARVTTGKGERNIVCGAANIRPGQIVPLVLPGGRVQTPAGEITEISSSRIRGEESAGMLASPLELGHGEDHQGILILPREWEKHLGRPLLELWPDLQDSILEIENKALTHRPDGFGQLGLAREIAAAMDFAFRLPRWWRPNWKPAGKSYPEDLKIKVMAPQLCPRYSVLRIEGVKIQPSPLWLQQRLLNVGVRPINNIVDVTNYVMMELGQPMHAFDAEKIAGRELVVRRSKPGEKLKTLDGQERKLQDALVIASRRGPLAIAGIMGGEESEISDRTTTIILEAATFNKVTIRRSARRLGLRSEASLRFEKGLDPNLTPIALARAVDLIRQLLPQAKISSSLLDVYPHPVKQWAIKTTPQFINKILGGQIPARQMEKILRSLGLKVKMGKEALSVTVPTFRPDLQAPEDLAEEIGRLYGYQRLPARLPQRPISPAPFSHYQRKRRQAKEILAGLGLDEVYSYAFVGQELYRRCRLDGRRLIPLSNPLSPELAFLADSLLPRLIEKAVLNQPNFESFGLFELASVFQYRRQKKSLPRQPHSLAAVLLPAGNDDKEAFLEMKGKLETLLRRLRLPELHFEPEKAEGCWQPAKKAGVYSHQKRLGELGLLHPLAAVDFELKRPLAMFELDFDLTIAQAEPQARYRLPFTKALVKQDVTRPAENWQQLWKRLEKEFGNRLLEAKLLGIYEGKYSVRLWLKK